MSVADILPSQLAAELLRAGTTVRLRAEGGSMKPWLRPGRIVTVEPLRNGGTLRVGDVAFTLTEGRAMLHRVVQISPKLVTKGDALSYCDPPPQTILGRAVGLSSPAIAAVSRAIRPMQRVFLLIMLLFRSAYDHCRA